MIVAETPRLTLRNFAPGDEAQLAWIYTDPDVMRYIPPGAPWEPEKIVRFVAICQERYITPGFGMWAVATRDKPETILGHCGLQHLAKTEHVEVAWLFGKRCWNQGFATEAARAVLAHGFERLGLSRVVAVAEQPNGASFRVMQKLGMTLQGPVRYYDRDLTMYALEARDYVPAGKAADEGNPNQ